MTNPSSGCALANFLLKSRHLISEKTVAEEVCQLFESSVPTATVAITTSDGSVLAAGGPNRESASNLSLPDEWEIGPFDLGAELQLYGRPAEQETVADFSATAQMARAGVEHWQLESARRVRQGWGNATRAYTEALVEDIGEEEALDLAVQYSLEAAESDVSLLFLPGIGNEWTCEFAAGSQASQFIGSALELTDFASRSVFAGQAVLSSKVEDSLADLRGPFSDYGPVSVIPLMVEAAAQGALVLLRLRGRLPYSQDDLPLAEGFVATVALGLELERGRKAQSTTLMLEERERISRDLHDLGIQLLFAAGIQLDKLRAEVENGGITRRKTAEALRSAIGTLGDAVAQIRKVVEGLKETESHLDFVETLQLEASRSRQVLGFAPSLLVEMDGLMLDPKDELWREQTAELAERISEAIAGDAIATLRESIANAARHAAAHSVRVTVSVSGRGRVGELVLSIVDDGRGINPSRTRSSGIANMRGRALQHGGSFSIGLGPRSQGTAVVWRVPLG